MSAQIVPSWEEISRFPEPLTEGERTLVLYLENALPDGWTVYLQPFLNGSRPDLVLFHPQVGVMIYEVKDWHLARYQVGEAPDGRPCFQVRGPADAPLAVRSPLGQVEYYRRKLIEQLLPALGEQVDRDPGVLSVVKVGLYFHQATTEEARALLAAVPHSRVTVVGHDALGAGALTTVVPDARSSSSPCWQPAWNREIRFWLQPPHNATEQGTYLELTAEQKALVRPAPGHQRLRGVAGSGKTQVLAYRAAILASQGYDVLVLTYNITLWHYLRDMIARIPVAFSWERITLNHFHGLCRDLLNDHDVEWPRGSGDEFFERELPELVGKVITRAKPSDRRYDAILIDEGQDFHLGWYQLLCLLLRPRDELLLVCDQSQNLYRRELSWIDRPMRGTKFRGPWRELRRSFRLPEKVAEAANRFSERFELEGRVSIQGSPQLSLFQRLPDPHLVWVPKVGEEWLEWIYRGYQWLTQKGHHPSDIVILLPSHRTGRECVEYFERRGVQVNHVFHRGDGRPRHKKSFWMGDGRLKMSTIHSFKGWELMNVLLYLPPRGWTDLDAMDAAVYTAITRTRENLIVLNDQPRYAAYGRTLPRSWARQ